MKQLFCLLIAFSVCFSLPNYSIGQCFPFVDYNPPTNNSAFNNTNNVLYDKGLDIEVSEAGNTYVLGLQYINISQGPGFNAVPHIVVYKLDDCGDLIWKTKEPFALPAGFGFALSTDVLRGKLIVDESVDLIYYGISFNLSNESKVYKARASTGGFVNFSNFLPYISVSGNMTDFDYSYITNRLFIATIPLWVGTLYEGFVYNFNANTGTQIWQNKIYATSMTSNQKVRTIQVGLNELEDRLYIGYTIDPTSYIGEVVYETNSLQTFIYTPEMSGIFYINSINSIGDMPQPQTPYTSIFFGIGDLETIESNTNTITGSIDDKIYYTTTNGTSNNAIANTINLLDGQLNDLGSVQVSSNGNTYNMNDIYFNEKDAHLYVIGKTAQNPEEAVIQGFEYPFGLNIDFTGVIGTAGTGAPFVAPITLDDAPFANGVAGGFDGKTILMTGSIVSISTPIPFGNSFGESEDGSDILAARLLNYGSGLVFGKGTSGSAPIASKPQSFDRIEAEITENEISLLTNPVSENIHLLSKTVLVETASFSLFNNQGQELKSIVKTNLEGIQSLIIDVTDLSDGLYYLRINLDGKITTEKVLVIN